MPVYAEVAVGTYINGSGAKGVFDYLVPEEYNEIVYRGQRVIVPFSGRLVEGCVMNVKQSTKVSPEKLKSIRDISSISTPFTEKQLQLAEWMSDEYLCSIGECLKCIMPAKAGLKENRVLYIMENALQNNTYKLKDIDMEILNSIKSKGGSMPFSELNKLFGSGAKSAAARFLKYGLAEFKSTMNPTVREKLTSIVELNIEPKDIEDILKKMRSNKNRIKQAEALEIVAALNRKVTEKELIKNHNVSKSTIDTLAKNGLLKKSEIRVHRDPYAGVKFKPIARPELTSEQQSAIDNILAKYYNQGEKLFLLHGITGSGKTEVYMRLIEHMIEKRKQSIVLVPEISLTPQTVEWFKGRFERVAVLHSRLSKGERYDEWDRIKNGEIDVVVGARSAVFAPLKNLGLIIIDEEHETSYKSDITPKYHAKDVAVKRCEIEDAMLILGSATPSVETYFDALGGKYVLCNMNYRIDGRKLPEIFVSDMRLEMEQGNRTIFSRRLYEELKHVLSLNQQAILFLNRRGYSTFVSCRKCGQPVKCPKCDVSLTYHADTNILNCHYCGFTAKPPEACPSCGSKYIKYFGIGTQKVEREVKRFFPSVRVLRMDLDTTSQKGAHTKIYNAFKNHEADILIGTQMISKGLDFPGVTLVGIIAADLTLNIPDFRSAEKSFQLITQVSGRAGRGLIPGKVVIQTYNPEHYSISASVNHDYMEFYKKEIEVRKAFEYPPFSDIVNIVVSSKTEKDAISIINELTDKLRASLDTSSGACILGPTPAPISKINTYYRWQTIIKGSISDDIKKQIKEIVFEINLKAGDTRINMDVNPVSLA